jgi:hypothetical protein
MLCSYCGLPTFNYTILGSDKIMCIDCEDYECCGLRDQEQLEEIINDID